MNENIRLEWFKPDLTAPLEVPLMDSGVHAGFPSPADDSIEQPLDLNKLVAPNPNATFFARVVGDSMKDAHIEVRCAGKPAAAGRPHPEKRAALQCRAHEPLPAKPVFP